MVKNKIKIILKSMNKMLPTAYNIVKKQIKGVDSMENMVIKITGSRGYQDKAVKNIYVYVNGVLRGRYATRNVQRLLDLLKEDADEAGMNFMVAEVHEVNEEY